MITSLSYALDPSENVNEDSRRYPVHRLHERHRRIGLCLPVEYYGLRGNHPVRLTFVPALMFACAEKEYVRRDRQVIRFMLSRSVREGWFPLSDILNAAGVVILRIGDDVGEKVYVRRPGRYQLREL